jgi:hypothetical protein
VRKLILTGVVLAFALALASAAIAKTKTLYFEGSPTHDHDATIQFTVKGTMTKGKFSPTEVLDIHVFNQEFSCYSASGQRATSGRLEGSVDDYGYPDIKPVHVKKNGSFSGSLTDKIADPLTHKSVITTLLKFSGKIVNKRATGTYQSKTNPEGGIDDGYCGDAKPVDWVANRTVLAPLPPDD